MCSMGAGLFYGGTWVKGVAAGGKLSRAAFRSVKTALTSTKSAVAINDARKVSHVVKETGSATQKVSQSILKNDIVAAKEYEIVSRGAETANAGVNLNSKLRRLQSFQLSATRTRTLPDGRIRYYNAENMSKTYGPTRGACDVVEWNPKTGDIRGWFECHDHLGNVNRVHPKNINGQNVISPHYPPTGSELIK